MEIKGEITDIIYQNDVNSYTIAVFETDEEETTIVGYLPFVKSGDTLKVNGRFVEHKDYGTQFKVETFEKLMPETLGALERYLANGSIKGIGEATAKKIIKKFGEDTINIFKFEPQRLSEIKGISENKAIEMSESFIENWEVWQIVGFLDRFGLGAENAKKVYNLLGINAIEQIEANPYILIDIARGVDFKQIDQMALKLGINHDNQKRVESGIKYSLIKATYNGHSCVIKENLIEFVISLLDVTTENVEDNLISLKAKDEIIIEKREGQEWIYLENFYKVEQEIALKLARLEKSPNIKEIKNIDEELKKIEKKSNIELSDKQRDAIKAINKNNVTIITGGPGTGKTTIIKTIIELYEERKKKVVLAAPTGRAAKRLSEVTGIEACTIHRLLKWDLNSNTFAMDATHPLDYDLLVIDEFSMVDTLLFSHLLEASSKISKVLFIGDDQQLPSVSPGNVLKDLIESKLIQTIQLNTIYRQANDSGIIKLAHSIRNNNYDTKVYQDYDDVYFNQCLNHEIIKYVTFIVEKAMNEGYDMNDIQVLAPMYNGVAGIDALKNFLRSIGMPLTFAEVGGKAEDIETMAHTACYGNGNGGTLCGFVVLNEEDVANIYRLTI